MWVIDPFRHKERRKEVQTHQFKPKKMEEQGCQFNLSVE